jgi:hypothetical protein
MKIFLLIRLQWKRAEPQLVVTMCHKTGIPGSILGRNLEKLKITYSFCAYSVSLGVRSVSDKNEYKIIFFGWGGGGATDA